MKTRTLLLLGLAVAFSRPATATYVQTRVAVRPGPVQFAIGVGEEGFALTGWEVSPALGAPPRPLAEVAVTNSFQLFRIPRERMPADSSVTVDLSAELGRGDGSAWLVLARTTLSVDEPTRVRLALEAGGELTAFANKKRVFASEVPGEEASPSPTGSGTAARVDVDLNPGLNELFLMVKEGDEEWSFRILGDAPPQAVHREHQLLEPVWETDDSFLIPESALYDETPDVLYATSYNRLSSATAGQGFTSRVSPEGVSLDARWVEGLDGPCEMGLEADRLFVAESTRYLVEIDVETGEILARRSVPDAGFPNDVAIDAEGNVYISDTASHTHPSGAIYRFHNGAVELWLAGEDIARPNSLFIKEGWFPVGSSGDCLLKAVDLATRDVREVAELGGRIIDGIRVTEDGTVPVTLWEGEAVLIDGLGRVVEILSVRGSGINLKTSRPVPRPLTRL